jgi:hypothetical protein
LKVVSIACSRSASGHDHGLRPLGHGLVERAGLLGDGLLERPHAGEQRSW